MGTMVAGPRRCHELATAPVTGSVSSAPDPARRADRRFTNLAAELRACADVFRWAADPRHTRPEERIYGPTTGLSAWLMVGLGWSLADADDA